MNESRFDQIRTEHQARVEQIGRAEADRELYRALARVEAELDDIKARVLSLVQIEDRRGPFLPPLRVGGSRLPGPPQQEIRDALARIVRLGMAPIDMDCLAPDEDAALRVLIRALVRAYPKEYEWDVQPPSIDFAEMEAQLRARIDPVPQAGGPVPGGAPQAEKE